MHSENGIVIFAATIVGLAVTYLQRESLHQWWSWCCRELARVFQPVSRPFDQRRFLIASFITFIAFAELNLLPYVLTRNRPQSDGFQTLGFPGTFWTFGGFSPAVHFYPVMLVLDVAVGVAASVICGYAIARLRVGKAE